MITRQELAEQVRDLIGEDRLEDALRLLTEHRGMHNLRNDVAMLAGRLERLRRQERLQTEGFDELNREQNRIREAILEIASNVESGKAVPVLSQSRPNMKYAAIVIGIILLAAGTIYVVKSSSDRRTEGNNMTQDVIDTAQDIVDTLAQDGLNEQDNAVIDEPEDGETGAKEPVNDTVIVASVNDFVKALRPGAILKFTRSMYLDAVPAAMEQSKYINYSKNNSSELELTGLDSVTFIGPASFYSSDLNSDILNLNDCTNIAFKEITFRHNSGSAGIGSEMDPQPAFTLNIKNCKNVEFENCHLIGKAADFNEQNDAIQFTDCGQLIFKDCTIENYSGFIAAGSGSNGVFFQSTTFNMCFNAYQTGFMLKGVNRAIFSNCTMKYLQYQTMFSIDRQLIVKGTNFDQISYKAFAPGQISNLNFDNTVLINGTVVSGQNIGDIDSWGS